MKPVFLIQFLKNLVFVLVYLKTTPEIAHRRVLSRSRSEEKTISLEYLESIHKAHEKWLMDPNQRSPVFVVDANKGFNDVIECCQKQLPVLFDQELTCKFKV